MNEWEKQMAVEEVQDFDPVAHIARCARKNKILVGGTLHDSACGYFFADVLFSGPGETRVARCHAAAVLRGLTHGMTGLIASAGGRCTADRLARALVILLRSKPRVLAQAAAFGEPRDVREAVPSAFNQHGPLNRSDAVVFELLRRLGRGIDPTRVRDPREPFSICDVATIGD